MRTGFILLLAVIVLIGCESEPLPDSEAALASLVATERAFSQASVEHGQRTAFLGYLAEGSIIFSPTPTDARALYTERPEAPTTLVWHPAFADIAATGDLGYTTGPWTFSDSTGAAIAYGHYVTVWRVQPDSTWRVEIDAGVSHPSHERPAPEHVATPGDSSWIRARRKLYQEAARVSMLKADRDLAQASLEGGSAAAFSAVLADSVRFYRDGVFPGIGKAAMVDMLRQQSGVLSWVPINAAISRAGDLGYTYGLTTFKAAPQDTSTTSNSYLRIWKAQPDSTWLLVVDLVAPVPSE